MPTSSDLSQPPDANLLQSKSMNIKLLGGGKSAAGISLEDMYDGGRVTAVALGSMAEKSGLQAYDVIKKVAGKSMPLAVDDADYQSDQKSTCDFIAHKRKNGKIIQLSIQRPASKENILAQLRYEVNAHLGAVRNMFGAESDEYKQARARAMVETSKLEEGAQVPLPRDLDEKFSRIPYNPIYCKDRQSTWTFPEIYRKDRTTRVHIGKEQLKDLKLGLQAKWQPRHCYVKSCNKSLYNQGIKPGCVVRAVDMVRCPPRGGPKQAGNAKEMIEALLLERVTLQKGDVVLSVESMSIASYATDCICVFCPCTWLYECTAKSEVQRSRGQVLDDCLCCCNFCCNTMEEDFHCCQRARKMCCAFNCINCVPKLACLPLTIAAMMAGISK